MRNIISVLLQMMKLFHEMNYIANQL